MTETATAGPWAVEGRTLLRATAGGMLFGIPLLYTMEVWFIGGSTEPARLLAVLAATALPVFVLNRTDGFRSRRDVRLADALIDTVKAMAVAMLSVGTLLVLLREVRIDSPPGEVLGKIVYEASPFAIGISLARHFLSRGRDEGDESDAGQDGAEEAPPKGRLNATLVDLGASAIGSLFVASSIAPTDEVALLAAAMGPASVLAVLFASVAIAYGIVFEAGFVDEEHRKGQRGVLQRPVTETVASYLIGLTMAALMLWFFQRTAGLPPFDLLDHVIVLGLPSAIGGAAGRLVV